MRKRIGNILTSYWTSFALGLFLIGEIIFLWNLPEVPQYIQDFVHYIFILAILSTIGGLIVLYSEHKKRGAK